MTIKTLGLLFLAIMTPFAATGCGQLSQPAAKGTTSTSMQSQTDALDQALATPDTTTSDSKPISPPPPSADDNTQQPMPLPHPAVKGVSKALAPWTTVPLNMTLLKQLQDGETQGHRPSLLIADQVAQDFVDQTPDLVWFKGGERSDDLMQTKQQVIEVVKDGLLLRMHLVQPVKTGKFGIWAVDEYQIVSSA